MAGEPPETFTGAGEIASIQVQIAINNPSAAIATGNDYAIEYIATHKTLVI